MLTWLGAAAFLLYNSLMFVFATPVNPLFLLYVAMLSLSAWSIATVLWQANVPAWGHWPAASHRECRCGESPPTYGSSSR